MLINPDSTTSNSSAIMPVATVCSHCGVEERRLMHQVRHRGLFRRLCTTCVLRLHPQSFCPTCFQVYPAPPSNDAAVSCVKCYSSSHSRCVGASSSNSYICPLCLHPNTPIFKLRSPKMEDFRAMDRDAAKKLVAAAKIASVSMNKAAVAAKAEAERRAREAAYARKRAKEALEHVAFLVTKEKPSKREVASARPGNVGTNGGYKIDRETNVTANANANASSNNGNGNVGLPKIGGNVDRDDSSLVLAAGNGNVNVGLPKIGGNVDRDNSSLVLAAGNGNVNVGLPKIGGNVDRDNSSLVLAALNAVELKENEKKNTAPMDVDEKGENLGGLVGERKNDTSSDGPSNLG